MKLKVTITGCIDIPDDWNEKDENGNSRAYDITYYRYNDQLDEVDSIDELAKKLKCYPDDFYLDKAENAEEESEDTE